MIILHHLAYSRSIRVLWLLEELGIEYDLVCYDRTADFRAPAELAAVHPLGKSPVIVDGGLVLAESSAILRYIHNRHGQGALTPSPGTDEEALHDEWLDFVESSAALPILMLLRARMKRDNPDNVTALIPAVDKVLSYISDKVKAGPWLMGSDLTLADMQMSYLLAMAEAAGVIDDYPAVSDYLQRIRHYPSFVKATSVGGPMLPEDMK